MLVKMKKYIKWIILAIILITLLLIMIFVKSGKIQTFDTTIYNIITYHTNPLLDNMFHAFTFFGSTIGIVLLCLLLLIIMKNKKMALTTVGCVGISTIINFITKITFQRERPVVRKLVEETTYSFPSGHTMAAASLYGILIFFIIHSNIEKKKKVLFSTLLSMLILAVGISRIYLGAHFASDVLGGMLSSIAILIIFTNFFRNESFS